MTAFTAMTKREINLAEVTKRDKERYARIMKQLEEEREKVEQKQEADILKIYHQFGFVYNNQTEMLDPDPELAKKTSTKLQSISRQDFLVRIKESYRKQTIEHDDVMIKRLERLESTGKAFLEDKLKLERDALKIAKLSNHIAVLERNPAAIEETQKNIDTITEKIKELGGNVPNATGAAGEGYRVPKSVPTPRPTPEINGRWKHKEK